MKITNVKRIEMDNIDLSGMVRYSAILNGNTLVQYQTDGIFIKHLSKEEWIAYVKKQYESNS
jgi:hypothetical protein